MADQNKAAAEEITFYSYWLSAMAPGEYSVTVTPELKANVTTEKETSPGKMETVTETRNLETSAATETFHVGAPRYALTGSEAYSCYPAPGQIGQFYDTLPHIVFDRCTLPWERTIDGTDPSGPHDPWLALILLTDADFSSQTIVEKKRVPPIVATTLATVLHPEANVIGPAITLDKYDSETDPCRTIDLPASVFSAVMPHKADLNYLAHVRDVKTDNKETWSLLKEGKFSVVICNRFPESQAVATGEKDWGIVNTVCLVSLEGWGGYLNDPATLDAGKSYRLLVLGSWRFACQGSSAFKSLMEHLNKNDQDNRLLSRPPLNGDQGEALKYINDAFRMGFAPINHDLRNGDTTISWYRGPLVPMSYERSMSYTDISCADAALRYNSETAMFDASYAAAWQLGRLLALQDQAFGQALFRFRTEFQRWVRTINTAALKDLENQATKLQNNAGGKLSNIRSSYVEQLQAAKLFSAAPASPAITSAATAPAIPVTVQNWLGQAMLLYGVPFQYLVPDDAMLPAESVRFFYLNPEWLNCLLQGACSVGRTSQTDELADQLLRARFFEVSQKLAKELRSYAQAQAKSRRGDGAAPTDIYANDAKLDENKAPALRWPLSGYLLRSAAVEAWIGLEAKAKGVASTGELLDPLQILRMDRLAPDILLCLYNGKVTEIEVKQPPEAIHFGAQSSSVKKGRHEKTELRKIKSDATTLKDKITVSIDVPMSEQRVVQVYELAAIIQKGLIDNNQLTRSDSFTSAEFAVEMIESPAKVIFQAT